MKFNVTVTLLAVMSIARIVTMAPESKHLRSRGIEELLSKPDVAIFAKSICERAKAKAGSGTLDFRSPPAYIVVNLNEKNVEIYEIDFPDVCRIEPTGKMGIDEFCKLSNSLQEKNNIVGKLR